MNKSKKIKDKTKKVMFDKKLAKLLKKESKFKYMIRKDKTMKKCHNFCKNDRNSSGFLILTLINLF